MADETKAAVVQKVLEQNVVVTSVSHEHLTITGLFSALFLNPTNVLIFVFLVAIAVSLKKLQRFPDWAIFFMMPTLGIMFNLALRSAFGNVDPAISVMVGTINGIAAVSIHQLLKQALESPAGPGLLKVPGFAIFVAFVDADLLKPAIARTDAQMEDK